MRGPTRTHGALIHLLRTNGAAKFGDRFPQVGDIGAAQTLLCIEKLKAWLLRTRSPENCTNAARPLILACDALFLAHPTPTATDHSRVKS